MSFCTGTFDCVCVWLFAQVVTSVRERLCGSPEEQPSPWLWQHQQGTTASRWENFHFFTFYLVSRVSLSSFGFISIEKWYHRDSTDSAVSGSTVLSSSRVRINCSLVQVENRHISIWIEFKSKFSSRLVLFTQELHLPPVTTTITNMTNAFTVSVLQTGDSKIFGDWESIMLFKSKSLFC